MIDILVATYNGESFLKNQLNSLLNQTYTEFNIIIRDDGSTDNTLKILNEFKSLYPDKITLVEGTPTGSAKNNFFELMNHAKSDYIMFCDQDDYWLPDKVELTLAKMKQIEKDNLPSLVHTDLFVTDKDLNITHKSFYKMQHFDKSMKCTLGKAIAQNTVTGCTVMINRPLLELAKNDNCRSIIMHDWWLSILAAAFGTVAAVKKPLMLYRQHGNNSVGAKTFGETINLHLVKKEKNISKALDISYAQGLYFAEAYKDVLPKKTVKIIKGYCDPSNKHEFYRLWVMLRYGFLKQSFIRKCAQLVHSVLNIAKNITKKILRRK